MIRAFFLVVLCLAMPAQAQVASQPSGSISITQDSRGDAAIEARIEGIIAELKDYGDVEVEVREGIVTFSGEVLDTVSIARLDELAARVDGVVAIENTVVESTDVARRLNPVAERFAARGGQALRYLPLLTIAIVAGLLVIFAGIVLARWDWPWRRLAPNAFIGEIYRMLLRLAFVLAGIVVALDILNATAVLTGLLGAAGIVGLAVGFAVRDTVENFIASVMLSLRQPFRPNDFVDIEGSTGSVIRLTSRATILLDPDGNHVRLPNSFVFKAKIINYTRNAERRFGFALGVDPNDDLAQAKRIGLETLISLDFILTDPPPQVWIKDAGDSTVSIEFYGWLNQHHVNYAVARGEAIRLVMGALTQAGIGMPEPTYRLNVAGGGLPVIDLPDMRGRSDGIVATEGDTLPDPIPASDIQDVAPDRTIERMVRDERRADGDADLLSEAAPRE